MSIDGIWVGEFAQAGYIKPLSEVVGPRYQSWDGWAQIKEPVQGNVSFQDERYGIPAGTDGRVIFFNKKLFQQAGLPADWQPTSWDDIAAAAEQLKTIDGITPLQLNAGSAMGEATTMQGILPLLVGTGAAIYTDGKWLGNTPQLRDVLGFYDKVYNTEPRRPAAAAGRQGPRRVVRRVRRQQDRHAAGERLLLAQRRRTHQGRRADGRPGRPPSATR